MLAELVRRAPFAEATEDPPTAHRAVVALQQCVDCGATAGLDVAVGDTTAAVGTCDPLVLDMSAGPTLPTCRFSCLRMRWPR